MYQHRSIESLRRELAHNETLLDVCGFDILKDKAIQSFGKLVTNKKKAQCPDGRRDTDAAWGVNQYRGVGKDGKPWQKKIQWFGYKLHLLVDATYEFSQRFHCYQRCCR